MVAALLGGACAPPRPPARPTPAALAPVSRSGPLSHVLDNGLRVIVQQNNSAPVVALQMWVDVGSADDPAGREGMAHALEHMIFKGTQRRGEGQIAREIEGAGGTINAWTSHDQTVFHVVLASRFFQRGLDILADAMGNARFDPADLGRELSVIREEIAMGADSPAKAVSRLLFGTAYRKHPFRKPVIGALASVGRIRRPELERFYRAHYRPERMTLVVVGDVQEKRALAQIRRAFAAGSGGEAKVAAPSERVQEPGQRRLRVAVQRYDTQEAYFALGFHIPGIAEAQTPALDLAAAVLGEGESSRLSREVKHRRQLVNTVHAYAYTPRDPGLLVVGGTAPPDKLARAVEAVATEVFALAEAAVAAEELRRAKTLLRSEAVYQKETVQGQARKLGFFHTVAGDIAFERVYDQRLMGTTAADLRAVAKTHLRPQNLSLVALAPGKGGEAATERKLEAVVKRAAAAAGKRSRTRVARDGRVIKVTLDNGARLLVLRDPTVPLVSMRAAWQGGLRYETAAENGVTNLLSTLITRGTHSRSAETINETVEGMAGVIGGFAGNNSFGVHTELLADHWEQGLEILADCVQNPAFAADELDHARRRALEELAAQQDNAGAAALRLFARTLYRQHPYRLSLIGSEASLGALGRAAVRRHYEAHYPPGRMVLAVVGDVDPVQVTAAFRRLFGRASTPADSPPRVAREAARRAPAQARETTAKQQAHLVVGYPGVTLRSKDRYALEVLASLLSGQGGRLFLELRERQGLAYSVHAFSMEGLDPGYFAVYVATSPDKVDQAALAIVGELIRLREAPVGAAELKRVQRYLVGTYEISLQRKSMVAAYLAFAEAYGMGYRTYTRYAREVMAVTPADLQRVARKYFVANKQVITLVSPEQLSAGAEATLGAEREAGVVNPDAPARKERRRPRGKGRRKR